MNAWHGSIYGTTTFGGDASCGVAPPGCGVIYKVDPVSGKITTLYSFTGGKDGAYPLYGSLAVNSSTGTLYGTTQKGGNLTCNPPDGCGVIFSYVANKGIYKTLHAFNGKDGEFPESGVVFNKGFLYGTTANGGANGKGVAYWLDLRTEKWERLHDFGSAKDGATPIGGVTVDPSGNVYGTTESGGQFGYGTLFEIDTTGKETILHDFSYTGDGGVPFSGVTYDALDQILYGTTTQGSPGEGEVWEYCLMSACM